MTQNSNQGTGRVWLVTGASSGFGRALTDAAIAAGDVVVAAARRPGRLDALVAEHPDRVEAIGLDVTDTTSAAAVIDDVVGRYGRLDVLVNNAGRAHIGAVEETSEAELRDLFDLHFFGPAALTRAALPHFRRQGSGAVVMMSSMGGQTAFAGISAYSATKFALEGFSEALAEEVAGFGTKVLIVEPGGFRTNFFGDDAAFSTETPAYADTVGRFRQNATPESLSGDPAKAAAAILAALAADPTPLRLPLGGDAVDAIRAHLDQVGGEIDAWEAVSRDTLLDTILDTVDARTDSEATA